MCILQTKWQNRMILRDRKWEIHTGYFKNSPTHTHRLVVQIRTQNSNKERYERQVASAIQGYFSVKILSLENKSLDP